MKNKETKTIRNDEVKVYKDKAGRWRWRVTADNGEIFGASHQSFSSKQKCLENYRLVLTSAPII